MSASPVGPPRRFVELSVDGGTVKVADGETVLAACVAAGVDTPTLCYGPTITPANACRVCVVELEGSRTLVPACSRRAETGMVVRTDTERVDRSRRLVLELLGSSVDLSVTSAARRWSWVSGSASTPLPGPPGSLPSTHCAANEQPCSQ